MSFKSLQKLRDYYFSKKFFEEDFEEIINPLLKSFNDEKGVPLDLEKPTEYYTSTTATTLLSLYHMKLLDEKTLTNFQDVIFKLKDNTSNNFSKNKLPEDNCAWDVSETASVWVTSLALWALLETQYSGPRSSEIKDALLWLLEQQRSNSGWGFDISCDSRIFFTATVVHVMLLAKKTLKFNKTEENKINRAINEGIQFVLNEKNEEEHAFWTLGENSTESDCTSTLFALWILYEFDKKQFQPVIDKGISFIREKLQSKEIWDFKVIVSEGKTKYSFHKIIASFTPAFPLILLKLGVKPFDELCLKPITWLKKNRTNYGWELPCYTNHALSFSTALGFWTINEWHKKIIRNSLDENENYPFILDKLRRRVNIFLVSTILITAILIIFFTPVLNLSYNFITEFIKTYGEDVSLLSAVFAVVGVSGIIPVIKYIDKKILNQSIKRNVANFFNKIKYLLYLK